MALDFKVINTQSCNRITDKTHSSGLLVFNEQILAILRRALLISVISKKRKFLTECDNICTFGQIISQCQFRKEIQC